MKPTETRKTNTGRKWRLGQRVAALPRRLWTLLGTAALIFAAGWFLLAPAPRQAPPGPPPAASGTVADTIPSSRAEAQPALSGEVPESATDPDRPSPGAVLGESRSPEPDPAFIQTVRLTPDQPTRLDRLQAEVVPAPSAPRTVRYAYRWRVNDRIVPEAAGDTLLLSPFNLGDLVSVTVTPTSGETEGAAVESGLVAVHCAAPTLELKAGRQVRKPGEPVALELIGASPDGRPLTFSLEPPLMAGMTVDRNSGKISWTLQPDQKGSFRFGAAVADDQGGKVTKSFEVAAE